MTLKFNEQTVMYKMNIVEEDGNARITRTNDFISCTNTPSIIIQE